MSLVVVDYGVGNLGSVLRAFRSLEADARLTSDAESIASARRLVLPGVGHFGEAMANLRSLGLEAPLRDAVSKGALLLGICVGFQMLFEESEEAPGVPGLGFLEGTVKRFREPLLVPHIGWNQVEDLKRNSLLEGVAPGAYFYFLHSYYAVASEEAAVWARTEYGAPFCSVAGRENVSGIQFHPEKSQALGLRVLRNFCEAL
jgi:glutamine amidotransferase